MFKAAWPGIKSVTFSGLRSHLFMQELKRFEIRPMLCTLFLQKNKKRQKTKIVKAHFNDQYCDSLESMLIFMAVKFA